MKEMKMTILSNINVGKDTYLMKLKGNEKFTSLPGQFCEIALENHFLRRPISIFDQKDDEISFLYKVLGHGTKDMSSYAPGKELSILLNLGNGFDLDKSDKPLLIGGGIGVAPLYYLAEEFLRQGKKVEFLLGFRNKNEALMIPEFEKLGKVHLVSDDGTLGEKGNPVTYLKNHDLDFDCYYACGPLVMLKFLSKEDYHGFVSLEARMGCGFGACMGCSIRTTEGYKRVCKEGPVFSSREVIYE